MEQEQIQKLNQLFNKFAQEEQASSFAVQNLLNRIVQIVDEGQNQKMRPVNNDLKKDEKE